MKLQKALAAIGAGVLLFAATDVATYAATGSSLVLGTINAANATTTIQNTGTSPALRLLTKSAVTAPMVVNGKGRVVNLYADRAATADNASKLGGQTVTQVRSGINASTVGGKTVAQIVSSASPHLARVIWVANAGGQSSPGVFTSLKAALASITDNDATHRYLIRIAPGTYTETGGVNLKNYVDVEGSGEDSTTITCACGSATSPEVDGSSAVMRAGPGMSTGQVRFLTVSNTGPNTYSTGLWTQTGLGVSFLHVTANASGAVGAYGMFNVNSSAQFDTVTAHANAFGGTQSFAFSNFGGLVTIRHSRLMAEDGADSIGLWNHNAFNPVIDDLDIYALGGTRSSGVLDDGIGDVKLSNLTVETEGGAAKALGNDAVGVRSIGVGTKVRNLRSRGAGPDFTMDSTHLSTIVDSQFDSPFALTVDGNGTIQIANSIIRGCTAVNGSITLRNVLNGDFVPAACN
jgi:pectin methylesterase-like acyl-CoA thioesterase